MPTPPGIDADIILSDGRRLAYAEYGDPEGLPVFLFHGLPGSRLAWGLLPDNPFPSGLRIVAPDRPGYGRSDPKPGHSLLDWAEDVAGLADALAIDRFAIVGISGGGPGALACAWKLPQRLSSVAVVSSPAPSNVHGVFAGMSKTNRFFMKLAWRFPWLSALNVRLLGRVIRHDPGRYIEAMQVKVDDVDRALLARSAIKKMLVSDFSEALRNGAQGMVDDMACNHGRPWGFALNEIPQPVRFWFCGRDRSVPQAMGRYLAGAVPNSETTFIADGGHLWLLTHLREVLERVVK